MKLNFDKKLLKKMKIEHFKCKKKIEKRNDFYYSGD